MILILIFFKEEIADFESLGQHNTLDVCVENSTINLQTCFPMKDLEFFQILE